MRLPFIDEDQELFFLETLVHETSHLHLFTIMDCNIIILNDEYDLYASPLRADKRPMLGVFHAVFVLSRMVRILHRYCNMYPENLEAKKILKKREKSLQEGISTVSTQAQLSKEGKMLFNTLEACAYG
jgi:HEXXH motif-containing protein